MRLSALEFKECIRRGEFERIEEACVSGEVSFRGETIGRSIRALYVTFEGSVDFTDSKIEGSLDLTGCSFNRTLSLKNAEIDGELILDFASVEAAARRGRSGNFDWTVVPHVLDARGIIIRGSLNCVAMRVEGDVNFDDARVDGRCSLIGVTIKSDFFCSNLYCESDFALYYYKSEKEVRTSRIFGGIFLMNANISGNLIIDNCSIEANFRMSSIKIKGDISIANAFIAGDCEIWSSRVNGNVWIRGAENKLEPIIKGHLHLGGMQADGSLIIESVTVGGALHLFFAHFGSVRIGHRTDAGSGEPPVQPSRIGSILADGLRVSNDVAIYGATLTGAGAGHRPTASFQSVQIGNDLRFWSAAMFLNSGEAEATGAPEAEGHGCTIVGDLDLTGSTIGGECDLTAITADGSILLDDAKVTGDVLFRSVASILDDITFKERFRSLYTRVQDRLSRTPPALPDGVDRSRAPRASVRSLSLTNLECRNDIDLSGLELRASADEIGSGARYGSLSARGLIVSGELVLHRAVETRTGNGAAMLIPHDAIIPGRANFENARINRLVLSASSFREPIRDDERRNPEETVDRRGINLAGATIDHVQIEPLPNGRHMFPIPARLAGVQVHNWNLGEDDGTRHARFQELLASDPVFRRPTYLHVEANLRNAGHEADADAVFRHMSRRALSHRTSGTWWGAFPGLCRRLLGWSAACAVVLSAVAYMLGGGQLLILAALLGWLLPILVVALVWDALLGFGTTPLHCGIAIAGIFLGSVLLVYAHPENIGATLPAETKAAIESAMPAMGPVAGSAAPASPASDPKPETWSAFDAVGLGLRIHVPLVSWALRDNWQLSDKPGKPLTVGIPGAKVAGLSPITQKFEALCPEDFGMIMMVINFLLWPPFLAFLLRRAFRYS